MEGCGWGCEGVGSALILLNGEQEHIAGDHIGQDLAATFGESSLFPFISNLD